MYYLALLARLHDILIPDIYLEIGTQAGDSLALSRSRTIAIDPDPRPRAETVLNKPWLKLYATTSDRFFAEHDREATLEGGSLDLAFIDGLHEFAQVMRDLENVERWAHPGTIVVIHDVLPEVPYQATRVFHEGRWTGDVWRVVPFLQEHRSDLKCQLVNAPNSGVLVVTGLDPSHAGMADLAVAHDRSFPPDGEEYSRLVNAWLQEAQPVRPEDALRAMNIQPSSHGQGISMARLESTVHRGMRILPESSWKPVFQRSIDAFYEGNTDEGIAACLALLNEPGLPAEIRELTYRNQTFYARPLDEVIPGAQWRTLPTKPDGNGPPDPSPAIYGERLIVLLRAGAPDAGAYDAFPWFDGALAKPELITIPNEPVNRDRVSEVRPFFTEDGALHVAALFHTPGENEAGRAGVMRFGEEGWDAPWLLGPRAGQFRQGWSPLVTDVGPRFVAWWEPTEVFHLDSATGEFERLALRMAPHIAERFQGGSQGVAVPGGYLFLVNETAAFDDGNEVSFCRFVRLGAGFQITHLSPQFYLAARGKDAGSGLARHDDRLIAGFTSGGTTALLTALDVHAVLDALTGIDAPGKPASGSPAWTPLLGYDVPVS